MGFAANHGEPAVSEGTVSVLFFSHIDASFSERVSGISCDGGAANAGARSTLFAEYQIHITGVAALFGQVSFPRWLQADASLACLCGQTRQSRVRERVAP